MQKVLTLPTPSIRQASAFDVNIGGNIIFNLGAGGSQFVKSSRVNFYDNTNGKPPELVATSVYNSPKTVHPIPPHLKGSEDLKGLENNHNYTVTVTVYSELNAQGDESPESIRTQIYCLPEPTLQLKAVPNKVMNTSYTFEAIFDGTATDSTIATNNVKAYQFTLLNEYSEVMDRSSTFTDKGIKQPDGTYLLKHTFDNLQNKTTYYLEVKCETDEGMSLYSSTSSFIIQVGSFTFGVPSIENDPCTGTINLQADSDTVATSFNKENVHIKLKYLDEKKKPHAVDTVLWKSDYTFQSLDVEIDKTTNLDAIIKPIGTDGLFPPDEKEKFTPYIGDLTSIQIMQSSGLSKKVFYSTAKGRVNGMKSMSPYMTVYATEMGVEDEDKALSNVEIKLSYISSANPTERKEVRGTKIILNDVSAEPHDIFCTIASKNIIPPFEITQPMEVNGVKFTFPKEIPEGQREPDFVLGTFKAKGIATDDIVFTLADETHPIRMLDNQLYNFSLIQKINLKNIVSLKIQRKRADRVDDKWLTLNVIDTSQQSEALDPFNISFRDITTVNGASYYYRLVPTLKQVREDGSFAFIEGEGDVASPKLSKFEDVFIADLNHVFKLQYNVSYNTMEQNQQVGIHNTLGNKYPIVITNSKLNYKTGGLRSLVLNADYGKRNYHKPTTNKTNTAYIGLDRIKAMEQREELLEFLTNRKPKILKDENGNIWIVMITGNPQIEFVNEYYMGIANIDFTWVEIGNPLIEEDLRYSGLIGGTEEITFSSISKELLAEITAEVKKNINENTMFYNQTYDAEIRTINKVTKTASVEAGIHIYDDVPIYGYADNLKEGNKVKLTVLKLKQKVSTTTNIEFELYTYILPPTFAQGFVMSDKTYQAFREIGYRPNRD